MFQGWQKQQLRCENVECTVYTTDLCNLLTVTIDADTATAAAAVYTNRLL